MRRKWWVILGCLIALFCGFSLRHWLATPQRTKLLLITLDTTRADRLGCYGYEGASTPTLDALAASGAVFERAYAPVPLTLPSHASLLSGLYPPEHGLHLNGEGAMPDKVPTLATRLRAAGYDTGAFVAAFVLDRKFGLGRDFATYDDDLSRAQPGSGSHLPYRDGESVVDAALRWLGERTDRPYFCWVHLYDAHEPYLAHTNRFGQKFADRPYDAELAYVDQQVKRLLEMLDRSGQRSRTIVAVVGDHGEGLGDHGERSHGLTLYNSVLNVPWIVSLPQASSTGRRVTEPVSLVDFTPTMLDCLSLPPVENVSGRSLRRALEGETSIEIPPCYAETDDPYRTAHWSPLRALITPQWKFIRSTHPELYDLQNDAREQVNLAEQEADVTRALNDQLADWVERMSKRSAAVVSLSAKDRKILESLGYAAGGKSNPASTRPLLDPKDMLPYFNLLDDARTLFLEGRPAEALPLLQEVVAADDEYFMAHGFLGMCYMRLGRFDEAIRHFRRTLELDPEAEGVHSALGWTLLQEEKLDEALIVLETALQLTPASHEAHFHMGLVLEKLQRPKEALEHYRACVSIAPDFEPGQTRLQALIRH